MQHLACLIATNTQQSMRCWRLHPGAPIARQADVRVLLDQEGVDIAARGMPGPLEQHRRNLTRDAQQRREFAIATDTLPALLQSAFSFMQPMDDEQVAMRNDADRKLFSRQLDEVPIACISSGIPFSELAQHMLRVYGAGNEGWENGLLRRATDEVLSKLDLPVLISATESALLGEERYCKRGAVRLWLKKTELVDCWKSINAAPYYQSALDVLQASRAQDARLRAVEKLISWAPMLPPDDVDRRMRALLGDPCEVVQRQAMLQCYRLNLPWTLELLMDVFHGVVLPGVPLPTVPPYEDVHHLTHVVVVPDASLAEIAALGLAYARYEPAVGEIQRLVPCTEPTLYSLAAALLGHPEGLQDFTREWDPGSTRTHAAVEATVRCQGKFGLDWF
jgi:hypothetical protein